MSQSLKYIALSAFHSLTALTLLPFAAYACSKVPVTVQRWSPNTVNFIGTALADTVKTGPGGIRYVIESGHFGPAGDRVIYGQRVAVERLPLAEQKMLPSGARELILIPWDYTASCEPTPWTRSARWLPVGTRGIYNAILRAPEHWINGVPTLDVMSPTGLPYRGIPTNSSETQLPMLSVDELFEIIKFLPDPELAKTDPEAATRPILQWAETHVELVERYPAKGLVWDAVYQVSFTRMRNTKPDIAGTWHFTTEVDGETPREFYGRTNQRPTSPWSVGLARAPARKPWEIPTLHGYYINTNVRPQLSELPTSCANRGIEAYVAQAVSISHSEVGSRSIAGDLELELVNRVFQSDPSFKPYKPVPAIEASAPGEIPWYLQPHAIFTVDISGTMRVSQSYPLENGRTLQLHGVRISTDVLPCEW